MKKILKSGLIVVGLAVGAVGASGVALADQNHHRKQSSKLPPAPPAAHYQMLQKQHGPAPHASRHQNQRRDNNRDRDRHRFVDRDGHHDGVRDRDRDRVRDRDHDRDRDRARRWTRDREHVYIDRRARNRDWRRDWDRDHDRGWLRYDPDRFGWISRRHHGYAGFGAQWMWWGGEYRPFDAPRAYRNCYPVVRFGYYHGRRARLGGTMCWGPHGTYLIPNSTFVINIY